MNKKRSIVLTIIAALSLSLCACASEGSTEQSTLIETIPTTTESTAESSGVTNDAALDGTDTGSTTAADTSFSNTTQYTLSGVYLYTDGTTASSLDPASPDLTNATAIVPDNSRYTLIDGGDCLLAIASLTGSGQSVSTLDLTCRNDSADTYSFVITCYVNGTEVATETAEVTDGSRRGVNIPIDENETPSTVFLAMTVTDTTTGTTVFSDVPAVVTFQ